MASKSDGTVVAWGDNGYSQTTVPAGLKEVTAVAAGGYHSVALTTDMVAPTVTATPTGGTYNAAQSVTLSANEAATIYYSLSIIIGSNPPTTYQYTCIYTVSAPCSTLVLGADAIFSLTYYGRDAAGNESSPVVQTYTIDTIAPIVTATPPGGFYNASQSVTLSANEPATIYYTVDGSAPTTASTVYTSPVVIPVNATTTLKYIGKDTAGNISGVGTQTYTIVVNTGFQNPTANAASAGGDNNGYQTTPANAYVSDGAFAVDTSSGSNTGTSCTGTDKDKHLYYNYGFNIPSGAVVNGIGLQLQAKVSSTTGAPKICAQFSWDGGTTWTSGTAGVLTTATLTTTNALYTLGGSTTTWGRAWTNSDFNNANFRVRLINIASSKTLTFSLDWVGVQVYLGVPTPPTITSTPVTTGTVGVAYSYQATPTGTAPITWSLVSGPTGMTINPSSGLVSWTPAAVGSYPVQIRATNTAGSNDQNYTIAVAAPDTVAPSVPTNLTATVISKSQVNLSWTGSTDNVGVAGYNIERCSGTGCTNFALIATVTGTSYSNTGLTALTTYRYQVKAFDAVPNTSGPSNIATATTLKR